MHIKKNVCDNVLDTLLNIKEKTKNNVKAHLDLEEMCIRRSLQSQQIEDGNKLYLPPTCYTMIKRRKNFFVKY